MGRLIHTASSINKRKPTPRERASHQVGKRWGFRSVRLHGWGRGGEFTAETHQLRVHAGHLRDEQDDAVAPVIENEDQLEAAGMLLKHLKAGDKARIAIAGGVDEPGGDPHARGRFDGLYRVTGLEQEELAVVVGAIGFALAEVDEPLREGVPDRLVNEPGATSSGSRRVSIGNLDGRMVMEVFRLLPGLLLLPADRCAPLLPGRHGRYWR